MTTLPTTKRIIADRLTRQVKAVVPTLIGISVEPGQIVFQKDAGEFTASEVASMSTVLSAYDAIVEQATQDAEDALRRTQLALSPVALSVADRVKRMEIILGID